MSILHLLCSPNLSPPCHSFRSCRPRVHIRSHGLAAANHRASLAGRPEYVPNRIHDANYIRILDTTLRDGEQSPGASMSSTQKLVLARQLAVLGVDVIEAGFPAASTDDFDAVRSIAIEVGNTPLGVGGHVPVIGGFCRCTKGDIDAAWDAVRHARRPRITAFLATSEIHMQHKLRKTPEQVVAIARDMVAYARALGCPDVEFIAEDSGRSNKEFLYHILEKVIQAGATTITIADTVGSSIPFEFGKLIADVKANTPGIDNAIISAHCHNDLGLASANTLAGAYAGARQLEVTINGIGERAGNASLEEVVMALKCRRELLHDIYTGINTQHITTTSKMVQEYSGLHVQPHKAIVGANAFAHASGIHQDGMLKYKGTYEIISPDDIGLKRVNNSGIVLGKLSGRHAVKSILVELGYEISDNEFEDFFKRYKEAADKKKSITDEDIQALLSGEIFKPRVMWSLVDVQATCGTLGSSTATVKLLTLNGEEKIGCSVGTSPIDAAYKAIDQIVQIPTILGEYNMTTEGVDAISTTRVVITADVSNNEQALTGQHIKNRAFSGTGAAKDVILSSARAYMSALNKMSNFIDARRSGSEALHSTSVQTKEKLGFAVLVSADQ